MDVAAIPDFTARTVRDVFGKETEFHIGEAVTDGGTPTGARLKVISTYQYSDEPIRRSIPGEYRQVAFVIKWPPPRPNAFLGLPFQPDRQINDSDEVIRVLIYVPEL